MECIHAKIKGKGKVHPRTGQEGPEGEKERHRFTPSLTSSLDGVDGQCHTLVALPLVQEDGYA